MTGRFAIFLIWCLLLLAGATSAAYYAWSPYSDDEREARPGASGPTHK